MRRTQRVDGCLLPTPLCCKGLGQEAEGRSGQRRDPCYHAGSTDEKGLG